MQNELMANGKLVTLLRSQNTLQDSITVAFQKELEASRVLHREEKRSLIRESNRLKKWVVGLGIVNVAKWAVIIALL